MAGAFLLRAAIARPAVRALGHPVAISVSADVLYDYGPEEGLKTGAWFDPLWSIALIGPLALAVAWKQPDPLGSRFDPAKRENEDPY